jgi:hypothetical protein
MKKCALKKYQKTIQNNLDSEGTDKTVITENPKHQLYSACIQTPDLTVIFHSPFIPGQEPRFLRPGVYTVSRILKHTHTHSDEAHCGGQKLREMPASSSLPSC